MKFSMNDIPSISEFSRALTSPSHSFASLAGFEPRLRDGVPAIGTSTLFAEAEITLDGERFILCVPQKADATEIARPAMRLLRGLPEGTAAGFRILPSELSFCDPFGKERRCDVLLQRLPEGETLDVAVTSVVTARILSELARLKAAFTAAGIRHRNLKPSNLIFGDDGRLWPVRCWYMAAESDAKSIEEEFDAMERFLLSYPNIEKGPHDKDIEESPAEGCERWPLRDMMRMVCREGLYGYIDDEGRTVLEPQYLYAESFFENRAVVQVRDGGFGVIDKRGRFVVEPRYAMVAMTEEGHFRVRDDRGLVGELGYTGEEIIPLGTELQLND